MSEITPIDGSLNHAASQFASLFSADSPSAEDPQARKEQPEQQPDKVAEQAPAAPEPSESEQATTDEEQSETAPETPPTYKAKVDGQEVEVTLEEALKGYSRTQDYTRKTQELAAQRREFEEKELSAVRAERQQYETSLGQLHEFLKASSPPEPSLATSASPEAFAVEWTQWKQHQDHLARVTAERQAVQARQAEDADKGFQAHIRAEHAKLVEAIPALSDAEHGPTLRRELSAYAKTRGFTDAELESVADHRMVVLLHDAMQGQKAKAKAPEIKQRVERVLESPKPGANNQPAKSDDAKAAMKRLRESGRVEDAAAAFATIFK